MMIVKELAYSKSRRRSGKLRKSKFMQSKKTTKSRTKWSACLKKCSLVMPTTTMRTSISLSYTNKILHKTMMRSSNIK